MFANLRKLLLLLGVALMLCIVETLLAPSLWPASPWAPILQAEELPFEIRLDPLRGSTQTNFLLSIKIQGNDLNQVVPPQFPATEQFEVRLERRGLQTSIGTGSNESSLLLSYRIYPSQSVSPGTYSLPDFNISVDGKVYPVVGPKLTITDGAQKQAEPTPPSDVSFRQVVDTTRPFVGQQVTYRAKLLTGQRFVRGDLSEMDIPSVLREDLGSDKQRTKRIGSKHLTLISEVLIPTEAGEIFIPPRSLNAVMRSEQRRSVFDFGPFSGRRAAHRERFTANGVTLNVRPLPPAPEGVEGYVPVGSLSIRTKIGKEALEVGQSTTLSIELFGKANLRPLSIPKPIIEAEGFKVYEDQPQLTTRSQGDKILYRKRFAVALVPTKPGELYVPQYQFTYFDPIRSKYARLKSEPLRIKVSGTAFAEPEVEPEPGEQAVELLGEGLHPQIEGDSLLSSQTPLQSSTLFIILLLVPATMLILRVALSRAELGKDQSRQRRLESLTTAQNTLNESEVSMDGVWQSVSTFLQDRLGVVASVTSADSLKRILETEGVSPLVNDELCALYTRLEAYRFSGQANVQASEEIRSEAQAILKKLYEETA